MAITATLPLSRAGADAPQARNEAPVIHYARYAHHYVYYPEGPIYYAPVRNAWFWREGDRWHNGERLPVRYVDHLRGGVPITLDTPKPFDRHEVVARQHPSAR